MGRLRNAARRLAPSASDLPTDVGYTGGRVGQPRLAPSIVSLVGPAAGGGSIPTIGEGTAVMFFAGSTAVAGPAVLTITIGSDQTFTQRIGASGYAYLRAADGFNGISWVSSSAYAFIVVDNGSWPSSIVPGQNQIIPTDLQTGGVVSTVNYDLGSGPFPLQVLLNAIAETEFNGGAGEVWELTSIHSPPSAALAGTISIFADAAETLLVYQKALAAVDTEYLTEPIEVPAAGVIAVNVTAAGAAGTALLISGRRVQ